MVCVRYYVMKPDQLSPDWDVANVKVFHIVRALHVIVDHTFACAAKRLDGVNLSLLQGGRKHTISDRKL